METKVSEILENILGLLALEGSFEVVEGEEEITATIEASDPGRLIGFKGETLDSLQLLVNQLVAHLDSAKRAKQSEDFKRVVVDVGGWRKNKEADLEKRALAWAEEVKTSGSPIDLEPMPAWQRRIVHMVVGEIEGVESESVGEGKDRHLVLKPAGKVKTVKAKITKTKAVKTKKSPKTSKE